MSKEMMTRRFSKKAGTYDHYAIVQQEMATWLAERIRSQMRQAQADRLLEIGCGTGRLTGMLHELFPRAKLDALDIAPGMLEMARERFQGNASVELKQADIEQWVWQAAAQSYGLIASSACFQWLQQPARTAAGLFRILQPGGQLFIATFGPGTFRELHHSFSRAYQQLGREEERHGLSYLHGEEWRNMLLAAGFANVEVTGTERTLYYPDVRSFLLAVKEIGANTGASSGNRGLGQRRLLVAMMEEYHRLYATKSGVPVTYELLYLHAGKQEQTFFDKDKH
ncbi:malonyl-ACP O-methyltransferase BioC [Brevibacillus ruminantium]|uniref:Malonyl-[acyl-carrier protein] O-methyltransferase n=1 Tax=Brevibacillus ruminantium TaxID=2950604 RepID=A0ABY4WEY4_9BACL|nr:malonyl-ACP O-methyltransferase BioC [Brevibacillus ruminantium]USG65416.1 malonyl-ACP O-methyltransferase BioC [Brevibacillus ruminantium]